MKKLLLLSYALISITCVAQDVMVTTYKNGHYRTDKIEDVEKVTFVNRDDAAEEVLPNVNRGLIAYYTFDNATGLNYFNQFNGFLNGTTFIKDTPSGTGQALKVSNGAYMDIPTAPLNGKQNYTVNLWIKDFGTGPIISSQGNDRLWGPTLYVTEDGKLFFYATDSFSSVGYITFSADLSSYQTGQWTMLTVVSSNENICTLYVNGRKAASGTVNPRGNTGAASMTIGGTTNYTSRSVSSAWADPMKIDNIRFYSVALTDEEVRCIYEREIHPAYVSISTDELAFDENTSSLSFAIKNEIGGKMTFQISDDNGILSIKPRIGEIEPFGSQEISVSLQDRDHIESFTSDNISVNIADLRHVIPVKIDKGINSTQGNSVTRGLQAYYNFDKENADDIHKGYYSGMLNGGQFETDTPNGKGHSLLLLKKEFMSITTALLDGKQNYTVNLWIKDFGTGPIISSQGNDRLWGPTLYVTEDGKLFFYATDSFSSVGYITFSADLSSYQTGQWTMLTVVSSNENISTLYINGRKAASGTVNPRGNTGATSMTIGGTTNYTSRSVSSAWADPMKIDNIRFHSVSLTDSEVMEIYNSERK